jgi:hypothetical protein
VWGEFSVIGFYSGFFYASLESCYEVLFPNWTAAVLEHKGFRVLFVWRNGQPPIEDQKRPIRDDNGPKPRIVITSGLEVRDKAMPRIERLVDNDPMARSVNLRMTESSPLTRPETSGKEQRKQGAEEDPTMARIAGVIALPDLSELLGRRREKPRDLFRGENALAPRAPLESRYFGSAIDNPIPDAF